MDPKASSTSFLSLSSARYAMGKTCDENIWDHVCSHLELEHHFYILRMSSIPSLLAGPS